MESDGKEQFCRPDKHYFRLKITLKTGHEAFELGPTEGWSDEFWLICPNWIKMVCTF